MANDLIAKWAKYYEDNGLQWLASQHVAAIKQAFFAGAEAVEQPLAPDAAYCGDCKRETASDEYGWCKECGRRR